MRCTPHLPPIDGADQISRRIFQMPNSATVGYRNGCIVKGTQDSSICGRPQYNYHVGGGGGWRLVFPVMYSAPPCTFVLAPHRGWIIYSLIMILYSIVKLTLHVCRGSVQVVYLTHKKYRFLSCCSVWVHQHQVLFIKWLEFPSHCAPRQVVILFGQNTLEYCAFKYSTL
jgi:hypothetical protein